VAQTLKALYVYARGQMLKANIENSPETLQSLIEKLRTVREAWYEADHRPAAAAATPAAEGSAGEARPPAPRRNQYISSGSAPEDSPYGPSTDGNSSSWDLSA